MRSTRQLLQRAPLLLIFGVRGCILERERFTVPDSLRPPDFSVAVNKVWMRPHFFELVQQLNSLKDEKTGENQVKFAFWSSQTHRNASAMAEGVLRQEGMKGVQLAFQWCREQTSPDTFRRTTAVQNDDEWSTLKDLATVWRAMPEFSPQRTVLVDDTPSKVRTASDNFVWVPPFGEGVEMREDDTFKRLLEFVESKLVSAEDVRHVLPHRIYPGPEYPKKLVPKTKEAGKK